MKCHVLIFLFICNMVLGDHIDSYNWSGVRRRTNDENGEPIYAMMYDEYIFFILVQV